MGTLASQALLVVLAPTIVAVADDLGSSVGTVGQARSITAAVAVVAALALSSRVDAVGVARLLAAGGAIAVAGCGAVAAAPTLGVFLAAHVVVGLGFACLLSAGFAGVAAFPVEHRARALGQVAGANALAWILVTPAVAALTDALTWRAAETVPAATAVAALAAAGTAADVAGRRDPIRLRALVGARSARRWIVAEASAYAAWTALLTFVGAYFVERFGVRDAAVGWFLAAGAAAYFVAATRSALLVRRLPHRLLVAGAAAFMCPLALLLFHPQGSLAIAVVAFCLLGAVAGVRTPASGALGIEQLPGHPASMMVARTAATQLGYLLGAIVGGAVIAGAGYGSLGLALAAGLAGSALLVLRVGDDPASARTRTRLVRPADGGR